MFTLGSDPKKSHETTNGSSSLAETSEEGMPRDNVLTARAGWPCKIYVCETVAGETRCDPYVVAITVQIKVIMSTVSSIEGETRKPRGAMLFTGPDGVGDFKVHVEEQRFTGHGSMSPEASSDTQYLYRAAPNCPHPPPKTAHVGEVGWGVPCLTDHSILKSGHQIKLKEFRQAAEDKHTHLYQNPYYLPPNTSSQPLPSPKKTVTIVEEPQEQHSGSEKSSQHSIQSQTSAAALPT